MTSVAPTPPLSISNLVHEPFADGPPAPIRRETRLGYQTSLRSAGRISACLWFVLLAAVHGETLNALIRVVRAGSGSWLIGDQILSTSCTVVFMLTLAWLIVRRYPAVSSPERLVPRIVALVGTYGVWLAAFLPKGHHAPVLAVASAALTLCGSLLIIASIAFLGRSFSIGPQARKLVVRGPYGLVRHPLYLAEEIALIGILLQSAWVAAVPFLLAHMAFQLRRMVYEERLLREVFDEYEAYAQRTARLIPGVW